MIDSLLNFVINVARMTNKAIPSFNFFSLKILQDKVVNHHGRIP